MAFIASGRRVLTQWFSYRKKNRERPIIGDRRPPSKLGDVQPAHWLAEYTTELLNVLHVLALVVEMEPAQSQLWRRSVKDRHLISVDELRAAGALDVPPAWRKSLAPQSEERHLFSDVPEDDDADAQEQQSTPPDEEG
jgi:hypothetical protein